MNVDESKDFREYIAEQIADYIKTHTEEGSYVMPDKMKILEKGVANICIAAYPEHEKGWIQNAAKIIRNTLDSNQLGMAGKMQRIVDKVNSPKEEVISDMLNNVIHLKANPEKASWVDKVSVQKHKIGVSQNAR